MNIVYRIKLQQEKNTNSEKNINSLQQKIENLNREAVKNNEKVQKLKEENEKLIKKLEESSKKYMEATIQIQELSQINAEYAKKKVCLVNKQQKK